jgi:hypothetical protein
MSSKLNMFITQAAWDEGVENLDSVRRENKNLAEEIKVGKVLFIRLFKTVMKLSQVGKKFTRKESLLPFCNKGIKVAKTKLFSHILKVFVGNFLKHTINKSIILGILCRHTFKISAKQVLYSFIILQTLRQRCPKNQIF